MEICFRKGACGSARPPLPTMPDRHSFQPTPKRLRVFGDSLAAAGTLGASIAVLNGHPIVGTVVMIIAIIGKFISNFFTENKKENE